MGVGQLFKSAISGAGRGLSAAGEAAKRISPMGVADAISPIPLDPQFWKERKGLATLFGVGGAAGLTNMTVDAVKRPGWESAMREENRYEQSLWLMQRAEEEKQRRLQRDMAENAARLAAIAPDVYNRVLAGRRLPRGAVVLGGQPRTDLLEELAYRMASGDYKPNQPTDLLEDLQAFNQ